MKEAKSIRKKLKQIIIQGNNDEIQKIFSEIISACLEEFSEDNYFTLAYFLQENLLKAIIEMKPKNIEYDEMVEGLKVEIDESLLEYQKGDTTGLVVANKNW